MVAIANAESRKVTEVVAAYEDRQITLGELKECLRVVSAETLQVVVTFSSARDASLPGNDRTHSARLIARTLATSARCLS